MTVFDDFERTLDGGANHLISSFNYLNESARAEAAKVRQVVEEYFARYPKERQGALRGRLRSPNDIFHKSAFFELTLHELALNEGCNVVAIEPEIAGTSRTPDFLIRAPDESQFYLEATLATGRSEVEAAGNRRLNEALAVIDGIDSPDFWLSLRIRGSPRCPIGRRHLQRPIERWLRELNYEEVVAALQRDNDVPELTIDWEGAHFRIEPVPRQRLRGEHSQRAIALFGPEDLQNVEPHVAIRESVKAKAKHYGDLDLPYVIAVNALHEFCDHDSVVDGLFGTEAMEVVCINGEWQHNLLRNPDGAWRSAGGPINTRVSAVLSTERLTPWSLGQRRARLTLNPWARRPLAGWPFSVDRCWMENDRLMNANGRTVREILRLPENWP